MGVVADVSAVVALLGQGIKPVLVVALAVALLAGIGALLLPNKLFKAGGVLLIVASLVVGVFVVGTPLGDAASGRSGGTTASSAPDSSQQPTTTVTTTAEPISSSTSTLGTTQSAAGQPTSKASGPTWYVLTAHQPVAFGNGHNSVNTITIGAQSYPDSIRATYPSSAADPNNRRTWLTGGNCTKLSAWVGKDAGSPRTSGTGRFVVQAEEAEMAAVEATISTPAQHMDVDITGVVRLTLFDTRGGSADAYNAWGTPRVFCSTPPGKSR
ncbi:NPCBM/NEW2 domain-containing protein [Lentzea tibetensis]|uniref:NPCBM/NEW2 domain-containing protein n=1 Tax=Lentzea tibetensis TaxID=2591470 RepID=UPI001F257DEA|nr:NPCBM/NEW2 domain-containing protein [Lentzea tibetensis]